MGAPDQSYEGSCACGAVRFRMESAPLVVHCCHCRLCQRQTGSAFAVNAMIESDRVTLLEGGTCRSSVTSGSGAGQEIVRCADCGVALWSHYARATDRLAFVRVGTLDDAHLFEPDVHIHLDSRLPWVEIPAGIPAYPEYYPASEVWSDDAIARRKQLFGK